MRNKAGNSQTRHEGRRRRNPQLNPENPRRVTTWHMTVQHILTRPQGQTRLKIINTVRACKRTKQTNRHITWLTWQSLITWLSTAQIKTTFLLIPGLRLVPELYRNTRNHFCVDCYVCLRPLSSWKVYLKPSLSLVVELVSQNCLILGGI